MLKPGSKTEMFLRKYGGIFGWCKRRICKIVTMMEVGIGITYVSWLYEYVYEFTYRLLYWKLGLLPIRTSQVFSVGRRRANWAGFISWSRKTIR